MGGSIVNEAFEEVLQDHSDLYDIVKVQVSVLCQLFKWLTIVVISLDIVRQIKIQELWLRVVIIIVLHSCSSIVHDYYCDTTSHPFYSCCFDVLPFTTSCNSYKPLMVSSTEYVEIEVMLKYFTEDKGNRNNRPYPYPPEALNSWGLYLE